MICRLLAMRCCTSCNNRSFCSSRSCISRSAARRSVNVFEAEQDVRPRAQQVDFYATSRTIGLMAVIA